jgi:hypothetical protein
MNPDLLALVCASWEGKEPKLGTAYAADSKHLLTARHLLFQDGQPGRIEFLLYRDRDRGVWTAAEIAWQPRAAERDVALLQAAALIERAGRANLSRALPGWNAQWTSAGFPRIGEETTDGQRRRDYVPLDGTVHAAASRPEQMQLAVDHWQVEPEDWRGLSGAPVFCDGELVGVIGSVPTLSRGGSKVPTMGRVKSAQ